MVIRSPHPQRHGRPLQSEKFAKNAAHKNREDESAEIRLRTGSVIDT